MQQLPAIPDIQKLKSVSGAPRSFQDSLLIALFLLFLDATTLVMLWLLWRQSTEPAVGIKAVALYSAALWTPFLYIEAVIPGTSLLASADVPVLRVAGMILAPNLIIAIVMACEYSSSWIRRQVQ